MNTFLILAFLFFIGSIIGWCLELFYRRFTPRNKNRKWINPGFLTGPYLPLYGFGTVLLYLITKLGMSWELGSEIAEYIILIILLGIAMTAAEYIAGLIFIKKMNVKLWDYSSRKGNIQGIICPLFSFLWTMIAAIYVFLIHPWIENALAWFSGNLAFSFVIGFFYGIFAIDVCYSFNLVAKIRNVAVEYNMQVRYEEFKEHIRKETEVRRTKYRFLLPFRSEKSVAEHLKEYFEEKKSADGSLKEHIKKLTPKKKRGKSENK